VPRRNLQAADHRDARADPPKPGQPARHDYEYERNGVAILFMVFAPLEGWRHVKPIFYVRRGKARFPGGRQTHPATFAPAK
jgi:hypothetical protein